MLLLGVVCLPFGAAAADEVGETVKCPPGSHLTESARDGATGCGRGSDGAIRIGKWVWRSHTGATLLEMNYDNDGREHGKAVSYGLSGNVVREQEYLRGSMNGIETQWWSTSGHLREQKSYRMGKLHGIRKRWYYEPHGQKDCSDDKERCWAGSQECWIDGERRPHEACNNMYALKGGTRTPAAKK